ncbi:MAG: TetR/AcrR family transcriptional regulator [Thermacetogeniaceae bacterium]|jgi:AcrR family transcriptional regulator|nr:TetR/AcrR family transcriptional regulator [Syntrophomonadaceae bacterium]
MEIASELSSTQQKILDAAVKVFSEKGFAGATTSEIAREAGVAEGTIFRHFGTKKGILQGILYNVVAGFQKSQVVDSVIVSFEKGDAYSLVSLIKRQLNAIQQQLPLLKMLFYEAQFHTEIQEIIVDKIVKPILDLLGQSIEKQKDMGEYRCFDTNMMVVSLLSSLWGYVVWKQIAREQEILDEEEALIQLLNIWLKGVAVNPHDC